MAVPSAATLPLLSDGIVSLRPLSEADIPDITAACQDPQVVRWTKVPTPYTRADAEHFVAERSAAGHDLPTWAITVLPDTRWVGTLDLRPDHEGGAEIGYLLSSTARGSGYAVRAMRLACGWAFSGLGLHVITWSAYEGNDRSLRAARQAGFNAPYHVFRGYGVQRGRRRDAWIGTMTPADLTAAVRTAETRRDYLGPELTRRERDVLGHLAQGEANRAIAAGLGISENTVKNHVRSILEKLQASSRSEAVVTALRLGLVDLPE